MCVTVLLFLSYQQISNPSSKFMISYILHQSTEICDILYNDCVLVRRDMQSLIDLIPVTYGDNTIIHNNLHNITIIYTIIIIYRIVNLCLFYLKKMIHWSMHIWVCIRNCPLVSYFFSVGEYKVSFRCLER